MYNVLKQANLEMTMQEEPRADTKVNVNSTKTAPHVIVLQWLSYAFWGWLAAALVWLMVVVLNLAMNGTVLDSQIPYVSAAVIVLLPIAYFVDLFYRHREPANKSGMPAVIMVIHAVIFALIAIGTLIGAVFVGVSLLTSIDSDVSVQMIALLSMLFAALLYGVLFVRIISPQKPRKLSLIVSTILLIVALGLLIWMIVGPIVQMVARKDDRRIEANLSYVQNGIEQYATEHDRLPDSLQSLDGLTKDAKSLADSGLVTYHQEESVLPESNEYSVLRPQRELRYQLCAKYVAASSSVDSSTYYGDDSDTTDGYKSYLSTDGHAKGEVCYKLQTLVSLQADRPITIGR